LPLTYLLKMMDKLEEIYRIFNNYNPLKEYNNMKHLLFNLAIALVLVIISSQAYAGWLIYHKPEFHGRVIDAETKEPIEGAVVVVIYNKITYAIIEQGTSAIKVKETLTDKNGNFSFPSYTTLIQPFSLEYAAEFIIYKPGYGNYPNNPITHGFDVYNCELFFTKETGSAGELEGLVNRKLTKIKVIFGIVELPELKTKEERLRARITMPEYGPKGLPLLYKELNDEAKRFGIETIK